MAATIGQKHKNGFKIVEIWDNHSESLKNNLYNDFKGPEHLLGGMNLENEIDTCQTTVVYCFDLLLIAKIYTFILDTYCVIGCPKHVGA